MRTICLTSLLLVALTVPAFARASKAPAMAPAFNLPATHGPATLDSLRGKVALVDFWASWCEPCRKSFPWMKSMYERYAAKGFTIVAINLDKDRDKADAFLQEFSAPFTVAFDPNGKTAEAYGVKAMPTSFLIAPDGKLLETHAGFDAKRAALLEKKIAGMLSQ